MLSQFLKNHFIRHLATSSLEQSIFSPHPWGDLQPKPRHPLGPPRWNLTDKYCFLMVELLGMKNNNTGKSSGDKSRVIVPNVGQGGEFAREILGE